MAASLETCAGDDCIQSARFRKAYGIFQGHLIDSLNLCQCELGHNRCRHPLGNNGTFLLDSGSK